MDNTDELLFKFKEHLSVLNRSPATIEAYTDHAKHFLKSITGNDIRQITTRMTQDYIAGLYDYRTINGKPYKTATICLKVRSIKRLFEFLEKANIIFVDPAEFITEPRQEKGRIKTTLTSKEAKKSWTSRTWARLPASVIVQSWKSFIPPASDLMSYAL